MFCFLCLKCNNSFRGKIESTGTSRYARYTNVLRENAIQVKCYLHALLYMSLGVVGSMNHVTLLLRTVVCVALKIVLNTETNSIALNTQYG